MYSHLLLAGTMEHDNAAAVRHLRIPESGLCGRPNSRPKRDISDFISGFGKADGVRVHNRKRVGNQKGGGGRVVSLLCCFVTVLRCKTGNCIDIDISGHYASSLATSQKSRLTNKTYKRLRTEL